MNPVWFPQDIPIICSPGPLRWRLHRPPLPCNTGPESNSGSQGAVRVHHSPVYVVEYSSSSLSFFSPINRSPLLPQIPTAASKTKSFSSLLGGLQQEDKARKMAGIVVVFDFDKTIIDCDSDNWVIDGLGATELFDRLLPTMPWNTLMDRMMRELHSQGRTIQEIAECLTRAPLDPHIITAIKSAYAHGCDLRVVSDANMFFIETILKHHGLIDYFSEINTNPGYVDEEGRLRILPYHDFTTSSHGCSLCPPNMCKGKIIERIRASEGKKRFIYLGDGKGDYCPSLKLGEGDCVMPRRNYPLWELICENPELLKAEVHEWSDGEEQERVLLQLISRTVSAEHTTPLLSVECKFETIPMNSHEAVLKALPVSQ